MEQKELIGNQSSISKQNLNSRGAAKVSRIQMK